jgi:hypothetical protein
MKSIKKFSMRSIRETGKNEAVIGHEATRSEPKVHDERRV